MVDARRGAAPGEHARAANTRVLGPRALATRRRLLDATAELLAAGTILDFKVVEVARAIGTSPATFYQYFPTVEDALLTLSDEANAQMGHLHGLLAEPWDTPESLDLARAFVAGFVDHVTTHQAVLRARDLKAQEGDQRFRLSRNRTVVPLTQAIQAKIEEAQAAGRVSPALHSWTAGGAMVSMLARVATFRSEFALRGVTREGMIETLSRILHQTVTGFPN